MAAGLLGRDDARRELRGSGSNSRFVLRRRGAVGVAILSSVAVSGAHGANPLAALSSGDQSAFGAAIIVAALGIVAAGLLLGRRGETEPAAEAQPVLA